MATASLRESVNNTGKRSDVWKSELGSGTVASQLADEIVECSKGRPVHQVVKAVEVIDELQEKHTDHCRQRQNVLVLELPARSDGGLAVASASDSPRQKGEDACRFRTEAIGVTR